MIVCTDGPARSADALLLGRAPMFLRVVHSSARGWDGLDQPGDAPQQDEQVYAYRRMGEAGVAMVDWCDRRGRRRGGRFATAKYQFVEPQPDNVTLWSAEHWQAWCVAQVEGDRPAVVPLTLLIDGDGVAWKAAYHAPNGAAAAANACKWIDKTARDLGATRTVICLGDPSRRYFRHDLFAGYKPQQRERPEVVTDAMVGMEDAYLSRSLAGLEADDVVGILATCPTLDGDRMIVADDKDLLTVPGRHFRRGAIVDVSGAEADCRHLLQTLIGDTGDGYPGCPGIGAKKAEQIVTAEKYAASPADVWRSIVWTFERAGLAAADAILQARLARICRHSDYDIERRAVRPWLPPELASMRMAVAS